MKKQYLSISKLLTMAVVLLIIVSCKRDNNYPGHAYFPDMAYSNAFETYASSPNFNDSIRMLLPVEGTIPRGEMPYAYAAKSFDDQQRAGRELVNPFQADEEVLKRGQEQFNIYCAMCHGEQGKGDGHLFKNGLFPVQPTALNTNYVQDKPDGEVFHVITRGSISGLMGAHGNQIKAEDRWKIVTYVKNGFKVN